MESETTKSIFSGDARTIEKSIVDRASDLAARSQILLRQRAVCIWLILVLACCGLLVLLDAFLKFEEIGLRLIASVTGLGLAGYWLKTVVIPAWKFLPTKSDAARWLDRNANPGNPDDQTLTFLELSDVSENDARFGSQGFRKAAMTQSIDQVAGRNWNGLLSDRAVTRPLSILALVVFLIGCFFVLSPALTWIGVQRLLFPLSTVEWPKSDQLEFVDLPQAVSMGSPLNVKVVDRKPPLPPKVMLETRLKGEPSQVFSQEMEVSAREATSNILQTQETIEVRALGGEDTSMDWQTVEVIRAPEISSFRFLVEPPAYVNQDPFELMSKQIQVVRGCRVKLLAELATAVQDVGVLFSQSSGSTEQDSSDPLPVVTTAAGGRQFVLGDSAGESWIASQSISWELELRTKDGYVVTIPERWSISVVDDAPPRVQLLEADLPFLTTDGALAISGNASDDIGLQEVVAFVRVNSTETEQPVVVTTPIWSLENENLLIEDVKLETAIYPGQLVDLDNVSSLSIWLEAKDTKGQTARSAERVFSIKESSELIDALGQQVSSLVERLAAIIASQERNLSLSSRTGQVMLETSAVSSAELEALLNVSQIEESLAQQLAEDDDSLANEFIKLTEHFEANGLTESAQFGQVRSVAAALRSVADQEMDDAVNAAYSAYQFAKTKAGDQSPVDDIEPVLAANQAYENVLEELQKILDRLNRTEASKQLREDLQDLLNQQEQVQEATSQLQMDVLSSVPRALIEANKVRLSVEQQDLSRQLDALIQRSELSQSGNGQAENISEVLKSERTSSTMRAVAKEIASEQLVDAKKGQVKAIRDLEQALSISKQQEDSFANRQADKLQEVGKEIKELAEQQRQLAEAMERGELTPSQLERRQQQLSQRVSDKAIETRADLPNTSDSLGGINELQREIEDKLKSQEQISAAAQAREVSSQLDELAAELLNEANQLSGQNRRRQVRQLVELLQIVVQSQAVLSERFQRLDPSDVIRRTELASEQDSVREVTREIELETRGVPAFGWTIERAVQDMQRTSAAARRNRLNEAQVSALRALDRLQMALSALESENANPQSSQGNQNAWQSDSDGQKLPSIASLKLLRALQMSINRETQMLNSRREQGESVGSRLGELAVEQQELGRQLEAILNALKSNNNATN